jgi:hypothetical protein
MLARVHSPDKTQLRQDLVINFVMWKNWIKYNNNKKNFYIENEEKRKQNSTVQ